jgi:hypothetical protein
VIAPENQFTKPHTTPVGNIRWARGEHNRACAQKRPTVKRLRPPLPCPPSCIGPAHHARCKFLSSLFWVSRSHRPL